MCEITMRSFTLTGHQLGALKLLLLDIYPFVYIDLCIWVTARLYRIKINGLLTSKRAGHDVHRPLPRMMLGYPASRHQAMRHGPSRSSPPFDLSPVCLHLKAYILSQTRPQFIFPSKSRSEQINHVFDSIRIQLQITPWPSTWLENRSASWPSSHIGHAYGIQHMSSLR